MKPSNRCSKRTDDVIMDAFISLVKKKGFKRVTVKDILENAHVNRSTFYRYYLDKFDLLLENQLLAGLREIENSVAFDLVIKDGITSETRKDTEKFIKYMYENGELFALLTNDPCCGSGFISKSKEAIKNLWNEKDFFSQLAVPQIYAMDALINTANGIIFDWAKNGFRESPEEFIEIYIKVIGAIPQNIFKNTKNP